MANKWRILALMGACLSAWVPATTVLAQPLERCQRAFSESLSDQSQLFQSELVAPCADWVLSTFPSTTGVEVDEALDRLAGMVRLAVSAHEHEAAVVSRVQRAWEEHGGRYVRSRTEVIKAFIKQGDFREARRENLGLRARLHGAAAAPFSLRLEALDWTIESGSLRWELEAVTDLLSWRDDAAPMAKGVLNHASRLLALTKERFTGLELLSDSQSGANRKARRRDLKSLQWHQKKLRRRLIGAHLEHGVRRALEALDEKDPKRAEAEISSLKVSLIAPESALLTSSRRSRLNWRVRQLENRLKRVTQDAVWTAEWHAAQRERDARTADAKDTQLSVRCSAPEALGVFISPERPMAELPFTLYAVSKDPKAKVSLSAYGPLDTLETIPDSPPMIPLQPFVESRATVAAWRGQFTPNSHGLWRVDIRRDGDVVGCVNVPVDTARPEGSRQRRGHRLKRPVTRSWGEAEELFYTLWLHHLFDEPEGTTWASLDAVTRDPKRNILFNHLGLGEDNPDIYTQRRARLAAQEEVGANSRSGRLLPSGLILKPDCADLVVSLRAYFAYKLGLPFAKFFCPLGRELRSNCQPGVAGQALRLEISGLGPEEQTALWARAREALKLYDERPATKRHAKALWRSVTSALGAHRSSRVLEAISPEVIARHRVERGDAKADKEVMWSSVAAREHGYPRVGEIFGPYCEDSLCTFYRVDSFIGLHEGPDWRREVLSVADFQRFIDGLASKTWSDQLRAPLATEHLMLYPVELRRENLSPGLVYVDPHSHLMTIIARGPSEDGGAPQLLAVDGQPDGTIAIKRFWRGTFVFDHPRPDIGAGFKAFRPLIRTQYGPKALSNDTLERASERRFSMAQQSLEPDAFYAQIDTLLHDALPEPELAYLEAHEALLMLLKYRVTAIAAGEGAHQDSPNSIIPMPSGREIFQTSGPWESFSTPCRDLRLLLAMDAITSFPERVARRPGDFTVEPGVSPEELHAQLSRLHQFWSETLTFSYLKSNGETHELSLAETFERIASFEDGYNPNDCPEIRWGAPEGSPERATCTRRAPEHQRAQMSGHRHWFEERYACR